MAKPRASSRGPLILLLLLLVIVAIGVTGYFKPDLPVIGPLVATFFRKAAEGVDKSGVYSLTVKHVAVSPEEFSEGENVDLQVTIERRSAAGESTLVWDSSRYGARKGKVGSDSITANWVDRPAEIVWQTGDKLIVKVWDRAGISSSVLCEYETDHAARTFPLTGAHTFELVKGKPARVKGANRIVFEAVRTGDLPVVDS